MNGMSPLSVATLNPVSQEHIRTDIQEQLLAQAAHHRRCGERQQAFDIYRRAELADNPDAQIMLGAMYKDWPAYKNLNEARRLFGLAADRDPEAYHLLAKVDFEEGEYESSYDLYQIYCATTGAELRAVHDLWLSKAECLQQMGNREAARKVYLVLAANGSVDASQCLHQLAQQTLKLATAADHHGYETQTDRTSAKKRLTFEDENPQTAVVKEQFPGTKTLSEADVCLDLGESFLEKLDFDNAGRYYALYCQQAGRSDADIAPLWLDKAERCRNQEKFNLAYEIYNKLAIAGFEEAYCQLGWMYFKGQWDSKMRDMDIFCFEQAAEKHYPDAHFALSVVYFERGQYTKAREHHKLYCQMIGVGEPTPEERQAQLDALSNGIGQLFHNEDHLAVFQLGLFIARAYQINPIQLFQRYMSRVSMEIGKFLGLAYEQAKSASESQPSSRNSKLLQDIEVFMRAYEQSKEHRYY